jgi:biotin carboxylase
MLKLAIVGAGRMARTYAIRAKELNIEVHIFAWEKGAIAKSFADKFHDISIYEKDTIVSLCEKNGITGMLPTTEKTIEVAAYIAEKLGLISLPLKIAENITSKFWVREQARGLKFLHQPEFLQVQDINSINIKNFPVIVKPASAGGKQGITVVYEESELSDALHYAKDAASDKGIIIEQFLSYGQEYSIESLSFNNKHHIIQITQKDSSGAPHCVELGHRQPADLSEEMKNKIIKAITELLNAVNFNHGPAHTEIKIVDDKIFLIELNSRPGGDQISYPLTELSTGYKYITGIILSSFGVYYDPSFYSGVQRYSGILFISKQTAHLKKIFDNCDGEKWLYEKHKVSEDLQEITHNDSDSVNYFIYSSSEKPDFLP